MHCLYVAGTPTLPTGRVVLPGGWLSAGKKLASALHAPAAKKLHRTAGYCQYLPGLLLRQLPLHVLSRVQTLQHSCLPPP